MLRDAEHLGAAVGQRFGLDRLELRQTRVAERVGGVNVSYWLCTEGLNPIGV
jgi:hypothetical protein